MQLVVASGVAHGHIAPVPMSDIVTSASEQWPATGDTMQLHFHHASPQLNIQNIQNATRLKFNYFKNSILLLYLFCLLPILDDLDIFIDSPFA